MPWYPDMRRELIETAKVLADPEYQRRVWVARKIPPGIDDDSFDYAIHFIYDDTCLGEDPRQAIGFFVRDTQEAQAIKLLVDALNMLFAAQGTELSDAEYISSKEWPIVLNAAEVLCQVLERDGRL